LLIGAIVLSLLIPIPFFDSFIQTTQLAGYIVAGITSCFLFVLLHWNKPLLSKETNSSLALVVSSPLTITFVLFALLAFVSTVIGQSQALENLFGISGVYLASALLLFSLPQLVPEKHAHYLVWILEALGLVVSVSLILELFGLRLADFYQSLLPFVELQDSVFIPIGSFLVAWQLVLISLVSSLLYRLKSGANIQLGIPFTLLIGLLVGSWYLVDTQILLSQPPLAASVHVVFESMKNAQYGVIGTGPDSVAALFTQYAPEWIQVTEYAETTFTQLTSVPLSITLTLGILGFALWIWLQIVVFANIRSHYLQSSLTSLQATYTIALAVLLVVGWFMPLSIAYLIFSTLLASFMLICEKKNPQFLPQKNRIEKATTYLDKIYSILKHRASIRTQKLIKKTLLGVLCFVLFFSLYIVGQILMASYYQRQSAAAQHQGSLSQTLVYQARSIQSNPFNPEYRRSYAVRNLEYASALSQKSELSDSEQYEVLTHIQTAINQAKAATVLQPYDSENWHTLALIYKNLIGTIDDADTWSVETYVKAIETAPTNPTLRIELGSILYSMDQYQAALSLFEQAAEISPQNPNAYYNAANTLYHLGLEDEALNAYQQTLLLLEPDSDLYLTVSEEFAARQEEIEGKTENE
jgi:tetratricopeptide (TPR) repeat protein